MRVIVDPRSSVAPYEQVRLQIAHQINDGSLAVGTKLPTVRAQATNLGIAANTVARAYRELEQSALIETRGRAGTFVGANGDRSRARAAAAAADFVAVIDSLGINRQEGLAIVAAALD